jgi:hypothetical protein
LIMPGFGFDDAFGCDLALPDGLELPGVFLFRGGEKGREGVPFKARDGAGLSFGGLGLTALARKAA